MASEKDVLRALAEDALERGVHADKATVLQEYVDASTEEEAKPPGKTGSQKGA
jgi:hypothetical protein